MHKYLKTIVFIAGAFAGIVALLGLQKLQSFKTIAALLDDQDASAVVRNYGLLAIGLVGIVTAVIRLSMADTQQRQEKRSDLFERFQKSSEMLNSTNIAVRQAGLYTLAEIGREQPEEFYIIIQSLFCGFLRHASTEYMLACPDFTLRNHDYYSTKQSWPPIGADTQEAVNLFTKLRNVVPGREKIEKREQFRPNMSGLFVPGHTFDNVNFSECDLVNSVFCDTKMTNTSFKGSNLRNATFDRADIIECDLSETVSGPLFLRWTRFDHPKISGKHSDKIHIAGTAAIRLDSSKPPFPNHLSQLPMSGGRKAFPHFDTFEKQKAARRKAQILEGSQSYRDQLEHRDEEERSESEHNRAVEELELR